MDSVDLLVITFFFIYPRCVGCLTPRSSLQASFPSPPSPGTTVSKVPSAQSLSLHSSSAGDLTRRNGCWDCNRVVLLPFHWKITWIWNLKEKKKRGEWFLKYKRQLLFSFDHTRADHECSSALPLKERLLMWFLNCSISSGFCCWICCANCCPLKERDAIALFLSFWEMHLNIRE